MKIWPVTMTGEEVEIDEVDHHHHLSTSHEKKKNSESGMKLVFLSRYAGPCSIL